MERLEFEQQRKQAQITIVGTLPNALGYGDWVEEIWLNYVSNAIKYGGTPPVITISAGVDSKNSGYFYFQVRDNGSGLTPEECASLFREHSRLKRHSDVEGHGLGLMIVRQMVERMGGNVYVNSKPGQGSTFGFKLPKA